MAVTTEQIKLLREKTGAGMLNCKKALLETNGNFEEAIAELRKKGLSSAEKKLSRSTRQGIITSYIHTGAKIGVLLELNCETDFVARRIEFQNLAKNLAMQIAAGELINYLTMDDIPQEIWDSEMKTESEREDIQNKPLQIRDSILKGRVEKILKEQTLLTQPSIRDSNVTVEDYIKSHVALLGENIQINRFCKFVIGQDN
ncbi:MAG: translation elongation factor Ts [Alphaproteobacteria bacterium]|nr:translation elongation factor Ts [Alphaproteobacteria bacterium]